MIKKQLAIVLGATSNMAFAAANVIIGLKNNSKNLDTDIILYNDGEFSNQDKEVFKKLDCTLITYDFPLKDNQNFLKNSMNQFTFMMYSRYECFDLLNEYKNVIWLDIDTVVQSDINQLIEECSTSIGLWQTYDSIKINFTKLPDNYNMDMNYYNSGVIIIKDSLESHEKFKNWCYEKTVSLADTLYCPDQGVLNLMLQEFNLDICNLDEKFNCHPTNKKAKKAIVLHSYRPEKFWNFWNNKEWNCNYEKWIELGGTPVKLRKASKFSQGIAAKWPGAPDPLRKPSACVKFVTNKIFKKV